MVQWTMDFISVLKIALFLQLSTQYCFVDTAVLDPALHLYPSPPLIPSDHREENEQWTRASRSTKILAATEPKDTTTATSTTKEVETLENAETFWPRLRSIDTTLKQVHIPVTFSLSGIYGGYRGSTGVIGNTYASVGGTSLFSYGKSALAGTGYGNYGSPVRIYGGNNGPAWTGWGNGKWGHYGKG